MKKTLFLILLFLLFGCNKNEDDLQSESNIEDIVQLLETPILTIDEETGIVSWDSIDDATYYNYIINDGEVLSTTSRVIALEDQTNVSVQAVNDISYSKWSNAVTFYDTSDIVVEKDELVTIYFHNVDMDSITMEAGSILNEPHTPSKNNCQFDNWYQDPFYQEVFDFSKPIYNDTIIYANWNESNLIKDVYFWIKANEKMSSVIQSSNSSWRFIPLKLNTQNTSYKEFVATVQITNASSKSPAKFLVMDGFDDNPGRTYWKNKNEDFTITEDGIYNIYFSLEHQWKNGDNIVHVYFEKTQDSGLSINEENALGKSLTPKVEIDYENNIARWNKVENATSYEVIINNKKSQIINENYISLPKNMHISVRAIIGDLTTNWSIPKANVNFIIQEENPANYYVYFMDSGLDSIKVMANEKIEEVLPKEDLVFDGWYLDIALTKKAEFPYLVTTNTVFYPKWIIDSTVEKECYQLVDEHNNKVAGLTWNIDNYNFNEYQTEVVSLVAATKYYITDNNNTWGPYSVSSSGKYKIYFSEEYLWNIDTEHESNVYIAKQTINIYFTNANNWSGTIYAYLWDTETGKWHTPWPGMAMTYVRSNSYGQKIYKIEIDVDNYDYVIFSNGSSQTVDISLSGLSNGSGFYAKSSKDGNKYQVGTFDYVG